MSSQSMFPLAPAPRRLAIIGTAGRDKNAPLSAGLWGAMLGSAARRVQALDTLISGGAAWADHLAVQLFLQDRCAALELYLPAPFDGRFVGPGGSSASAANYYHDRFSAVIGQDTLGQLSLAIEKGAAVHAQPVLAGYRGMFARNTLVAKAADAVLAYTFGDTVPMDSGTGNTWKQVVGEKAHVSLSWLAKAIEQQEAACEPVRPRGRFTVARS